MTKLRRFLECGAGVLAVVTAAVAATPAGCGSATPQTRACTPLQGPGTPIVQYLATLEDGRELMVMLLAADASQDEARVFFGTPPLLVERRVIAQQQPSLFTQVTFSLDDHQATAAFSSPVLADFMSYLLVGSDMFPLTVLPADSLDSSTQFRCLVSVR